MSYDLRPYQREACDAAWAALTASNNTAIVLPTGSGKSLVIAELARHSAVKWGVRTIGLAHRKELLVQNAEKIKALLPFGMTCGIFSAGLRSYAMDDNVVCCGIQSVYKRAADFGRRQLVIIDETHLLPESEDGMYRQFLSELGEYNPNLKLIGLTATPYRTSTGLIYGDDKMFSGVCYTAKIQSLIADGYLCPVLTPNTKDLYDTTNLHVRGGEFVACEVESLFDDDGKTHAACQEIAASCRERQSILIFSSGVAHADHIARSVEAISGEKCYIVTGQTSPLERSTTLEAFKRQQIRWLVNVDVLTTGFDAPCVDAIAVLRATMSPGLFAQMCGRGFRLHPAKTNCLVLDYGNNVKRHGPIDSDDYGVKPKATRAVVDEFKICPECETSVAQIARECECGYEFPSPMKQCPACSAYVPNSTKACKCGWIFANIDTFSDSQSQILVKPEKWLVTNVRMERHEKRGDPNAPNTLKVTYSVEKYGGEQGDLLRREFQEWVCLEHPPGFALNKANEWWNRRCLEPALDIDHAIELFRCGAVAPTLAITTMKDGRWDRVLEHTLDDKPLEWSPVEVGGGFDDEEEVELPF